MRKIIDRNAARLPWGGACFLALVVLSGATGAMAQQDAQDEMNMEEVIVTAKNREQNLQEMPLSISVFNNEQLQQIGILDARDVAQFTPSFNYYSGVGRGDPTALAVRGIAPNTSDERFQGLNIFVDGVALSGQTIGVDLSQLERVEVIKGPQSATFGLATYSGAVNYITSDPEVDRLTGYVRARSSKVDYGGSDESYYLGGRVDFPIIQDRLWGSVNAIYRQEGAVFQDPGDGSDIGDEKTEGLGLVLLFKPSDQWRLKLRGSWSEEEDGTALVHVQHPRYWREQGVGLATVPRIQAIRGAPAPSEPRRALWPTRVPDVRLGLTGGAQVEGASPMGAARTRDNVFFSLISDYKFDNGYTLSYKGAYVSQEKAENISFFWRTLVPGADPFFAEPESRGEVLAPFRRFESGFLSAFEEEFDNTSHQLLLLSPDEGPFRWDAGLYYFEEEVRNYTSSGQLFRGEDVIENLALFGGLAYDLTDRLTLSFEGRYQEETVTLTGCDGCFRNHVSVDVEDKETAFLPRLTAEYRLNDDTMVYALFARGQKSARLSAIDRGTSNVPVVAAPEELDNYEIGLKTSVLDGRGLLNLAVFVAEVENQQLTASNSTVSATTNAVELAIQARNVGSSDVYGFELEGQLNLTERLTLSAGIGYAKQEFTNSSPLILSGGLVGPSWFFEDPRGDGTLVLDGKSQANVPRLTGNLSAVWSQPVFDGYELTLRGDASYRGEFYADAANIAEVPDSWKLSMRAALANDRFEVALFGRNLTDDRTPTGAFSAGGAFICAYSELDTSIYGTGNQRCMFAGVPRPREFGLEVTVNF